MKAKRFTVNRVKGDAVVLSDVEACDWFRGGDRADAALEAVNILASELKQVKAELAELAAKLDKQSSDIRDQEVANALSSMDR